MELKITLIKFFSNACDGKHCMKSALVRSHSGPHFPAFGLNTERYSVSLRIESECGKMWRDTPYLSEFNPNAEMLTRITSNTGTFYAVMVVCIAVIMLMEQFYVTMRTMSIFPIILECWSRSDCFKEHVAVTALEHMSCKSVYKTKKIKL